MGRRRLSLCVCSLLGVMVAACSTTAPRVAAGGAKTLTIVAAENFWGSIVSQLAGHAAHVLSILSDPGVDPHTYESSVDAARLFANSDYVVVNGAGYDAWADKLINGNPKSSRQVLNVAAILGKKEGDNPHFWYNPDYVTAFADHVSADLKRVDPKDAQYFEIQRQAFAESLGPYRDRLTAIKTAFARTPVGATESIFVYLAQYLGLDLVSPREFMQAVAEGNDPPASAVAEFSDQVGAGKIKVLVYNRQTVTAVTTNAAALARQHRIPVVGFTETIQPPNSTFQDWQANQIDQLQRALVSGSR